MIKLNQDLIMKKVYLRTTFSNVMFQNQMTNDFLNKIKSLLIYTIESNLVARNWFNYTVSKYYNKHNN